MGVLGVCLVVQQELNDLGPAVTPSSCCHDPQGSTVLGREGIRVGRILKEKRDSPDVSVTRCEGEWGEPNGPVPRYCALVIDLVRLEIVVQGRRREDAGRGVAV